MADDLQQLFRAIHSAGESPVSSLDEGTIALIGRSDEDLMQLVEVGGRPERCVLKQQRAVLAETVVPKLFSGLIDGCGALIRESRHQVSQAALYELLQPLMFLLLQVFVARLQWVTVGGRGSLRSSS